MIIETSFHASIHNVTHFIVALLLATSSDACQLWKFVVVLTTGQISLIDWQCGNFQLKHPKQFLRNEIS